MSEMAGIYTPCVADDGHVHTTWCRWWTCTQVLWMSEMVDIYIPGVVDVRDGGHIHTMCCRWWTCTHQVLWMSKMAEMCIQGGCQRWRTCTHQVLWMSDMYIPGVGMSDVYMHGVVDVRDGGHVYVRFCGCQTCINKVWWMSDMYIQGVVDVRDGGHVYTRCCGCQTCTYKVWWMSEMADMHIPYVVDVRHVHTRCGGCQRWRTCTHHHRERSGLLTAVLMMPEVVDRPRICLSSVLALSV